MNQQNSNNGYFPQMNVPEAYVNTFKKALEIYWDRGYCKFSVQKLYLAKVYWTNIEEEKPKERLFGVCFCADYLLPAENGYAFRHLLLRAFGEENTITSASHAHVRMIPIKEGDLFDCENGTYKLLHGRIIKPKDVMNLDTVIEIFAESGLEVTKEDVKVARFSYRLDVLKTEDNPQGIETRSIGVCFLTEIIVDGEPCFAFVRAFHGKNSRITEIFPAKKCSYQAYGAGNSFKTSRGEWALIKGNLRDYKDYLHEKLEKERLKK